MKKYEIIVPALTIFNDDETIDYKGNKDVIDYFINTGMDGILALGSSGEFTKLSINEKKEFLKFYYEYTNKRIDLYAGTGDLTIENAIELSNYAIDLGYKAVLVITPFYYGLDQEKIFIYYDKLAKNVNGDIYIYNFPARSGSSINDETLYRLLKENKNIKGLKDSVTDYFHTVSLARKVTDEFADFKLYSGYDDQFLLNIASGGSGGIGGLSNIVPELWRKWADAANANNNEELIKIQKSMNKLMKLYDLDSNFTYLFKCLMKYNGLNINTTTIFPFNQISEEKLDFAKKLLDEVKSEY